MRKLEKETLQVISEIGQFVKYTELYELARGYRTFPSKGPIDKYFRIVMDIRLRADSRKSLVTRNVYMGMLVKPAPNNQTLSHASYSLVICKDTKATSRIIRKIHFDFEHTDLRSLEIKPSIHMQVCGKLNDYLKSVGYTETAIDAYSPDFEKPRIPCMPMCLALLIHWVFLEFECDKTAKEIRNNDQWRKHIAKAERLVLKPYFEACFNFLNLTKNNDRSFIEEQLYEVAKV